MRTLQLKLPDDIANFLLSLPITTEEFIIDSVKTSLKEIKQKKKLNILVEGYKASKKEGKQLLKEFENIDIENWDEY